MSTSTASMVIQNLNEMQCTEVGKIEYAETIALNLLEKKDFIEAFRILEHISEFADFRDVREFIEGHLSFEERVAFGREMHKLAFQIQVNAECWEDVKEYVSSLGNLFFKE